MQYKSCIDVIKYRIKPEEAYIRINGWAFEKNGQPLEIITEINGKVVPNRLKKIKRPDVAEKFKKMKVDKDVWIHIKFMWIHQRTSKIFDFISSLGKKKNLSKSLTRRK